jgi:hypothetical protein
MRKWIATQENSVKMVLYLFGGYYSIVVSADAVSSAVPDMPFLDIGLAGWGLEIAFI